MLELPKQKIFDVVLEGAFVATFSGQSRQRRQEGADVIKMVLKSVLIDNREHLQLNTYTQKQHFTTNRERNRVTLDELMELVMSHKFMQVHIQKEDIDQYYRVTAHSVSSKRTPASKHDWVAGQDHDQKKNYVIDLSNSAALLSVLGMTDAKGQMIPAMQAKYRQINHFLGIAASLAVIEKTSIRIIDCGCGKAYLSLALYHWLRNICSKEVELIGIDTNPSVIDFCQKSALTLGFEHCHFVCTSIDAYHDDKDADLVIALHACDTATDDALALALKHNAAAILAAPCCHHYVNDKLRSTSAPELVAPLLRDGITRERFSDLLTDTMRRDILRYRGYAAELIEFVAQEHTMKNIMIRAELRAQSVSQADQILHQLQAAREEWHVAPKLAELVGV